jgi:hypothetical protein
MRPAVLHLRSGQFDCRVLNLVSSQIANLGVAGGDVDHQPDDIG